MCINTSPLLNQFFQGTTRVNMGNDHSIPRNNIKNNQRTIRILVIGEQANGKSALINTLNASVVERTTVIAPIGTVVAKSTTTKFRQHRVEGTKVIFYDTPGMNFRPESEVQQTLLKMILSGLQENQEIPLDAALLAEKLSNEKLIKKRQNRIDFVLWVVDATELERRAGKFWKWTQISTESRAYYEDLFKFIRQHADLGYNPYLIFTKKDKTKLTPTQLLDEAFPWIAKHDKWIIQNYTERDQWNKDTEWTALKLLEAVCDQQQHKWDKRLKKPIILFQKWL